MDAELHKLNFNQFFYEIKWLLLYGNIQSFVKARNIHTQLYFLKYLSFDTFIYFMYFVVLINAII